MKKNQITNKMIIKDVKKTFAKLAKNGKLPTRGNYHKDGKYNTNEVNQRFGNWKGLMSAMGLEVTKEVKKLKANISKHIQNDLYRKYFKEEVTPWTGKYKKSKKSGIATFMIINDLHDIDVDDFTLSVFIDNIKRIKPDHVIVNGDAFDCPEFGRYTKDPRAMDAVKRFKFVHDRILGPIREAEITNTGY